MAEAIELGEGARGRTAPNPNVGCVIVRDGEIVGKGATAPGGTVSTLNVTVIAVTAVLAAAAVLSLALPHG